MGGVVAVLLWWRGPSWSAVSDAFTAVSWRWVLAAVGLNLLSVVARSIAWKVVIDQALPPPQPGYRLVFAAFSVGLFANAVLPGRIGELARVAVLNRKLPAAPRNVGDARRHGVRAPRLRSRSGAAADRLRPPDGEDPALGGDEPRSAFVAVGIGLLAFAIAVARHQKRSVLDELSAVRRVAAMARQGLSVMRSPLGAATAVLFQIIGWFCQLLAVWAAMSAFHLHLPLAAAGLVLLLMNVATVFPALARQRRSPAGAIAVPLRRYGVGYPLGFAFGIGLQAIEASVGIGVGLIFLAGEGLSFAMLRVMPDASQAAMSEEGTDEGARSADEPEGGLVGGRSG